MGAKAILDIAYQAGVVPKHLYGKTQHKTLQARLSEEILHHREISPFYRTEPGQFFLTEFLDADDIPEEWKKPFPARRRKRDLTRDNTLAIKQSFLVRWGNSRADLDTFFQAADREGALGYMHPSEMTSFGYCSTWTFSTVIKQDCVLAYRVGSYRNDGDYYDKRRSIGFSGPLTIDDANLFSQDHLGAEDCAVDVLMQDLDLSYASFHGKDKKRPKIEFVRIIEADGVFNVVIVLTWRCPAWFEPTTRRMSLNDPHWLCMSTRHNDFDDFEPWSSAILTEWAREADRTTVAEEAHNRPTSRLSRIRVSD